MSCYPNMAYHEMLVMFDLWHEITFLSGHTAWGVNGSHSLFIPLGRRSCLIDEDCFTGPLLISEGSSIDVRLVACDIEGGLSTPGCLICFKSV